MLDLSEDPIKRLVLTPHAENQWVATVTLVSHARGDLPVVFSATGASARDAVQNLASLLLEHVDQA